MITRHRPSVSPVPHGCAEFQQHTAVRQGCCYACSEAAGRDHQRRNDHHIISLSCLSWFLGKYWVRKAGEWLVNGWLMPDSWLVKGWFIMVCVLFVCVCASWFILLVLMVGYLTISHRPLEAPYSRLWPGICPWVQPGMYRFTSHSYVRFHDTVLFPWWYWKQMVSNDHT